MTKMPTLEQTVVFDHTEQAFLIKSAITSMYYLVAPYNDPDNASILSLKELKDDYHGFVTAISYSNSLKNAKV